MSLSEERTYPGQGSGPARYPGTFLLALREALAGIKWTAERWLGDAVECVDGEGRKQVVGLENLFRRARRSERGEWPNIITEFLCHASPSSPDEKDSPELAAVVDRLLLRVGQPFAPRQRDMPLWSRSLEGTDLVINLVIDYPHRMIYVTEQQLDESGKPGSYWLERALVNLKAKTPADCFQVIHEESGMSTCSVGDAYDSSRSLLLDEILPVGAADGFLVAMPGRDQLLVLPVTAPALAFAHLLKVLVNKNFKTVPYPITDQVFWVRAGTWRHFPIEVQGEKVTIQTPEEFIEVLKRLAPDEEVIDVEDEENDDEEEEDPDE